MQLDVQAGIGSKRTVYMYIQLYETVVSATTVQSTKGIFFQYSILIIHVVHVELEQFLPLIVQQIIACQGWSKFAITMYIIYYCTTLFLYTLPFRHEGNSIHQNQVIAKFEDTYSGSSLISHVFMSKGN